MTVIAKANTASFVELTFVQGGVIRGEPRLNIVDAAQAKGKLPSLSYVEFMPASKGGAGGSPYGF